MLNILTPIEAQKINKILLNKTLEMNVDGYESTPIFIAQGSHLESPCSIGTGTRINGPFHIWGSHGGKIQIGKFCAFGKDIILSSQNHDMEILNLNGSLQRAITGEKPPGRSTKGIIIGNNTWIGNRVIIVDGVTIGNGAIIGAGAVVTKDMPSYSIWAGSPARHIRYRFSQEIIDMIEKINWWDWTFNQMKKNEAFFKLNLNKINPFDLKQSIDNLE